MAKKIKIVKGKIIQFPEELTETEKLILMFYYHDKLGDQFIAIYFNKSVDEITRLREKIVAEFEEVI